MKRRSLVKHLSRLGCDIVRPVAMIVGIHDEDEIERLLMVHSPKLQAILAKSRKQVREGEVLSQEDFWAEVKASRASKRPPQKRKNGRRNGAG